MKKIVLSVLVIGSSAVCMEQAPKHSKALEQAADQGLAALGSKSCKKPRPEVNREPYHRYANPNVSVPCKRKLFVEEIDKKEIDKK